MNKLFALCAAAGICVHAQYTISTLSDSHLRTGVSATQTYIADGILGGAAWDPTGGFFFSTSNRIVHVNQSGVIDKLIPGDAAFLPGSLAADNSGNLYFTDGTLHVIRRVDAATGIQSIFAGGGSPSANNGDNGPATQASLDPTALATAPNGDLLIAGSYGVRKVTISTGIIATIAGTGSIGPLGDGGPALAAHFNAPTGVALDGAGNMYVADGARVRKITVATGIVSTIAGSDTVSDAGDNGLATAATLDYIQGIGSDTSGNVYVSTHRNIRKISTSGIITKVAGTGNVGFYSGDGGPAATGTIAYPGSVAVNSSGDLLFSDGFDNLIIKIDSATATLHVAAGSISGIGDDGPLSMAAFATITRMAFDSLGNLYIADVGASRVRKVSASTGIVTTVAGNGTRGVSIDGSPATATGIASGYSSTNSMALAIDSADNLYVSDLWKVRKISPNTGTLSTLVDLNPTNSPGTDLIIRDMVTDSEYLYIDIADVENGNSQILGVDLASGISTAIVSIPGYSTAMDRPSFRTYVYAVSNGLRKFDAGTASEIIPARTCTGVCPGPDSTGAQLGDGGPAATALITNPQALKFGKFGNILIADTGDARIRSISPGTGKISTIAGTTGAGCPTSSGPATSAKLSTPSALAVSPDGDVLFFDTTCGQLNKLTYEPSYTGYVDSVTCTTVSGWAADRYRPSEALMVSIYDGTTLLGSVWASLLRSDVGALLQDSGVHGFTFSLPASVRDGNGHSIHVVYGNGTLDLPASPKSLTCASGASYAGYVDSSSCTGISGWVADRNRPNTPITVSLWDGSVQIASTTAAAPRSDVGAVLNDNGLHGFSLAIPPAYANGIPHALQVRYESSATVVPAGSFSVTCGASTQQPNYAGYVDSATCSGIKGWAADRNHLNVPITVSLWDGASMIASTTAATLRSDVGTFLGDNGLHAFSLTIPSAYLNGVPHALQVRYETSVTQVPGAQANITCASSASYAGWVDSASCAGITGWAADKNRLNIPITVSLWDGATQIATTTANSLRADVGAVVGDNGLHGFSMPIPGLYLDGAHHTYQIRYEMSNTQLPGSPETLTCGQTANYTGYVDVVSCSTISGWAADRNALNNSVDVTVYEGASVLAIVSAGAIRSDVGSFLGDNGHHGFSLATPSVLKDGTAHVVTVYAGNSHTPLAGPQALTCGP